MHGRWQAAPPLPVWLATGVAITALPANKAAGTEVAHVVQPAVWKYGAGSTKLTNRAQGYHACADGREAQTHNMP
eukprot:12852852-Alexandrium_andersonii.AAC.1